MTCGTCSDTGLAGDGYCACQAGETLRARIEASPEFAEFRRQRAEVDRMLARLEEPAPSLADFAVRNLESGDRWRAAGCPPGEITLGTPLGTRAGEPDDPRAN